MKTVTIASAEELALFAKSPVNGENANGKHTKVYLTADIDLGAHLWNSIKMSCVDFYGQNHTIKNVTVIESSKNSGLFGEACISTVRDLTVDGARIEGINHVAVIAGDGLCGFFYNCHVKNSVVISNVKDNDDGDKAGAICGYLSAEPNAYVKGCTVENCTITAYRDLGAVVGYANGTSAEVSGCTVKDVKVICKTGNNYKDYTTTAAYDANQVVGENYGTVKDNTVTNVEVSYKAE